MWIFDFPTKKPWPFEKVKKLCVFAHLMFWSKSAAFLDIFDVWNSENVKCFLTFYLPKKKWKCYAFLDIFDFDILLFFVCTLSDEISGFSTNKSWFLTENTDFWRKIRISDEKILILCPKFLQTGAKSRIIWWGNTFTQAAPISTASHFPSQSLFIFSHRVRASPEPRQHQHHEHDGVD